MDCYSILTYPALQCNLDVLMEAMSTLFNYNLSLTSVVIIYKYIDIYNVNTWLEILLCSPLDAETCRGALFNQCILSCVLMALVYIHNAITWIQMWKQCVVFLQQTLTSKYTTSRCSFTIGADNYHTKTKNSNQMPNNCSLCTFSILMCLPISPYNSHKHLHICTQPTFRSCTLTHAAGCLGKLH